MDGMGNALPTAEQIISTPSTPIRPPGHDICSAKHLQALAIPNPAQLRGSVLLLLLWVVVVVAVVVVVVVVAVDCCSC